MFFDLDHKQVDKKKDPLNKKNKEDFIYLSSLHNTNLRIKI